MNWVAACSTNGCNAEEPAAVMLPDTVKSIPLLLLFGGGLAWFLGAHPDNKTLPIKIPDKANTNPLLPLSNERTPPKIINFA
jgi:hypothetical protein